MIWNRTVYLSILALMAVTLAWASAGPISTTTAASAAPNSWRWQDLTPPDALAPAARSNGTAVYDPVGRQVVVFGGRSASGFMNDTWAFSLLTRTWKRFDTSGTPPAPRLGHNAEYDPVGHQMVVWAGQGSGFFDDTWTLNLQTLEWKNVSPDSRPRSRYGAGSVYDPASRSVVIFAGFTSEARRFNDTQSFSLDTNSWTDLSPSGDRPQIRCLLTAAYDPTGRRMIIYGGQRNGPLDDLWSFDLRGGAWTEWTPGQRPAGRIFASSFVDRQGRFIVFGGQTGSGSVNETWAFSFETRQWSRVDTPIAPAERNGMMGAYIPEDDRFIIFGGTGSRLFSDVWELRQQ